MDELADGTKLIKGDVLKLIVDELSSTEAFKNATLHIIDKTTVNTTKDTGIFKTAQTMKLTEGSTFSGNVFIHSISLGPKIYDPQSYSRFTNKDAVVTPIIYDVEIFEPYKYITLRYNVETLQDRAVQDVGDDHTARFKLHELLEDVIDSLAASDGKYMVKHKRDIMIRGIWEEHTGNDKSMSLEID